MAGKTVPGILTITTPRLQGLKSISIAQQPKRNCRRGANGQGVFGACLSVPRSHSHLLDRERVTPNTSWPPSGEPLPHISGIPEVPETQGRHLPTPNLLSGRDEEENSSLSSEDNVDFDDVGVTATSLIRGNIHISLLISWCTLTQQVWCKR
jgi:hypothetical protein